MYLAFILKSDVLRITSSCSILHLNKAMYLWGFFLDETTRYQGKDGGEESSASWELVITSLILLGIKHIFRLKLASCRNIIGEDRP